MFLTVARGPSRSVFVRLDDAGDLERLEIHVAPDISPGESSFALFECGAAVQQFGADFLVSRQWLRRHALLTSGDADAWDERFEALVDPTENRMEYVPAVDAVRVVVVVGPEAATT